MHATKHIEPAARNGCSGWKVVRCTACGYVSASRWASDPDNEQKLQRDLEMHNCKQSTMHTMF